MNVNIEELITLNYELEGLLYMVLHRGEETPDKVWQLIAEKIHGLSEGIAEHRPEAECTVTVTPTPAEEHKTPEPEPEILPEAVQEPVTPPAAEEPEIAVKEEEPVPAIKEPVAEAPKPVISLADEKRPDTKNEEQGIRLDEKLARRTYKDLRKAFSLNDRFRFRRELFGNSESDFSDAINMIEAMSSLEEANEYFYDDLKWDKNSQEVQDFMAIVEHHFA